MGSNPTELLDTSSRYGEDVVLTNVVAFDVQVWDPTAPVFTVGNPPVAIVPGDPGFTPPLREVRRMQTILPVLGAYVDLNWLDIALGS